MSRAVYEERQAKKLKDLLNWAKSFIFKNQELANSYETPESIELSNYYIACRNDTLPYIYKYDKKGFPEDLNEYNMMTDGQQFYIEAYELNTKYVGNDSNRFKQVRSSVHNKNIQMADPPYKGNVFEVNPYYRGLYCEYGLDIVTTRAAKEYSLLYYDKTYVTTNINVEAFLDLYTKNREWFSQVMENRAMTFDNNQRQFNCMFITLVTIFAYMDTDLQKQFSYDLLDQYDIRNALYSFGITFLNDLPFDFQLRVVKNIRRLIKAKGTDQVYSIIAEDIFSGNLAKIYKYYLYRDLGMSRDQIERFNNGTLSYDEYEERRNGANLFFLRVPYDVYDIYKYVNETPEEDIQKFPFDDIAGKDTYWDFNNWPGYKVNQRLGDRSWIESKYIAINTEIHSVPDIQGLILFFSMLHETKYSFPIKSNTLKDPALDLFGLFVCALYLTKMHIDQNISDMIPPNSFTVSTVLATYLDNLDYDVYKEHGKFKSLTIEALKKTGYDYHQKDQYQYDTTVESQQGSDILYYGFAQHFKDNFEILKGLNNALSAVAYDDDDVTGIDVPDNHTVLLESLIDHIDTYFSNKDYINPEGHEDCYAEIIYKWLNDGREIDKFKHVPWLKTIIERALIIKNEEALFESRDYFTNKYGLFENMSIESFIAASYPIAYEKLANAILGDKKSRMELLLSIFNDISYTLANVYTYAPPPDGKKSKLTKDVNFNAFMQEYAIIYAVKLLEYLKSYTVQLHNSGILYDLTNRGQATIQMNDLFTGDINRKKILGEYIFTGKYPWKHDPDSHINPPYYDTDRVGNKYHNTTHERLIDEVQISVSQVANQINKRYTGDLGCYMELCSPDVTNENIDQDGGYHSHENSLDMKEQLFCRVIRPTSNTYSKYLIYKENALITAVGSNVLVSNTTHQTEEDE